MPPTLETATLTINRDEPAYSLRELNEPALDGKSVRRWQIIRVVRRDALVTWQSDLGEARQFDALQFIIPGGTVEDGKPRVWETVGSLQDMAAQLREDKPPDWGPRPDWHTLYHEEKERRKRPHKRVFTKGQAR
jgi:hypothetical protein